MAKSAAAPKAPKTQKKSVKMNINQFTGEIQKRAYEIYQSRINGNLPGDSMSDWLQAENEIKLKYQL